MTILSTEGVKNNLIFCTKQTGDKFDNIGTINVCVLYYQLIDDRDNADSSSYKILYLMACTCICRYRHYLSVPV